MPSCKSGQAGDAAPSDAEDASKNRSWPTLTHPFARPALRAAASASLDVIAPDYAPARPVSQGSVEFLFQKADGMLPEGHGGPKAFAKEGPAAPLTNGLLENGALAVDKLSGSSAGTTQMRCAAQPIPTRHTSPHLRS